MKEGSKLLRDLMIKNLGDISGKMIDQIMRAYRNTTPSQRLTAVKAVEPSGVNQYKSDLIEAMSALSTDAIDQARKEVPAASKVKLAEFDKLTPTLQKKLKTRTDLLVGKQISDLKSIIQFAYTSNEDTTDSEATLEEDINDSAIGFLNGTSLSAGAEITAATVIADARDAFFFDDDVLEEIDAFEFVNEDPVTPICQDLEGTIFSKDDPDMFRYTPPLHWNCKSWIRPILKGKLGDREVTKLKPSTKKLEDTIQFSEYCSTCHKKDC